MIGDELGDDDADGAIGKLLLGVEDVLENGAGHEAEG